MKSHYDPDYYDAARPGYPAGWTSGFIPDLYRALKDRPHLLDLGAGTGLSTLSLLNVLPRIPHLQVSMVEPHAGMLEVAQRKWHADPESSRRELVLMNIEAEKVAVEPLSVGAVIIGSAFHWMNGKQVVEVLDRALVPGGLVWVFEYQFPKAKEPHSHLNEWVRRKFNSEFKFEDQVPRGDLKAITEPIRNHSSFSQLHSANGTQEMRYDLPGFASVIFSQERYLDFESRNDDSKWHSEKKLDLRNSILRELAPSFSASTSLEFVYRFEGILFKKRLI